MRWRGLSRASTYAAFGGLLALGAPLGWLGLRHPGWANLGEELAAHALLYSYLTVGTATAFGAFGLAVGSLAGRLAAANRDLEHLAAFDALTGLRNARTFRIELERVCAMAGRSGHPAALIMLDLDNFKSVNDTFGHPIGDQALAHTGALLAGMARSADAAFRVGGEEFAVLCSATTSGDASGLAERLRTEMEARPLTIEGRRISVTGSFGVAELKEGGKAESLLRAADEALYSAKKAGRNRVAVAD